MNSKHSRRALPIRRSQKAFAWRDLYGVFSTVRPSDFKRLVQVLGIDTVSVMDGEPVCFIAGHAFSKLLQGPFGSRMSSDVKVKDSPRLEFHDHENIHNPERCGHNDKEVRRDHGFGMVSHEGRPALGRVCGTPRGLGM